MADFRPDVRLWVEGDRAGFQRGVEIAWLDRHAAELLWLDGPSALGSEVASSLGVLGLTHETLGGDAEVDRSAVFADAVCDGWREPPLELLARAQCVILGCGGLGSNLAIQLAALGARDMILVDGDQIEQSNLNRLVWCGQEHIGQAKVEALAAHLAARFGTRSLPIRQMVGSSSVATALAELDPARPGVVYLTVDEPLAAREGLQAILRLSTSAPEAFLPVFHAGYAGRYCVAGPVLLSAQDPCAFCNEPERRTAAGRPFVAPSAAPNNMVIASFLATQTLRLMARNEMTLKGRRWCLDLATGQSTFLEIAKDRQCPTCFLPSVKTTRKSSM